MDTEARGIPQEALTHAGVFHSDDVFAAALLSILNPRVVIRRSNVVPEDYQGIVFDIGGGAFDHHQGSLRYRDNGVPYSSFGLLWERYGSELLPDEDDALRVDVELVQPIDLMDNTGKPNPLSRCVSDFNPPAASSLEDFDGPFREAVSWARGVLERRIATIRRERDDREYLAQAMEEGDGHVLVLNRMVMWKHAMVGSGYDYVVYPSLRGGYNVQGVPSSLSEHTPVKPFPDAWRGRSARELQELTGVRDITFCHQSGFLCAVTSLEGALRIAEMSMKAD